MMAEERGRRSESWGLAKVAVLPNSIVCLILAHAWKVYIALEFSVDQMKFGTNWEHNSVDSL